MYCLSCNTWNDPSHLYCSNCGTRLSRASIEIPPALEEIHQLRQLLNQIDKRLETLEKNTETSATAGEVASPPLEKPTVAPVIKVESDQPIIEPEQGQNPPFRYNPDSGSSA